jgi:hypothetical protein
MSGHITQNENSPHLIRIGKLKSHATQNNLFSKTVHNIDKKWDLLS